MKDVYMTYYRIAGDDDFSTVIHEEPTFDLNNIPEHFSVTTKEVLKKALEGLDVLPGPDETYTWVVTKKLDLDNLPYSPLTWNGRFIDVLK